MIKPFTILSTRSEPDGGTGVFFEVSRTRYINEQVTETDTMRSYISVPEGEDVDTYLYNNLHEMGWV